MHGVAISLEKLCSNCTWNSFQRRSTNTIEWERERERERMRMVCRLSHIFWNSQFYRGPGYCNITSIRTPQYSIGIGIGVQCAVLGVVYLMGYTWKRYIGNFGQWNGRIWTALRLMLSPLSKTQQKKWAVLCEMCAAVQVEYGFWLLNCVRTVFSAVSVCVFFLFEILALGGVKIYTSHYFTWI